MKIACLQFAPKLGDLKGNIARANVILSQQPLEDLDLLVLPELALTGYNFPSLTAITPFLEPTASGPSTQWALTTSRRLNCLVTIGYPEVCLPVDNLPTNTTSSSTVFASNHAGLVSAGSNYNSAVTVAPNGEIVAHYRKSFLYYTDATWAKEGTGFHAGALPLPWSRGGTEQSETKVTMGICMDINPYNFTASWAAYEFANHVLANRSKLNILSMAWLSQELRLEDVQGEDVKNPDLKTLSYWVERFGPLIEAEGEGTILVMANRSGVEGKVCYAGTSTVMQASGGEVKMWDICGKGEERCLVVDTEEAPKWHLTLRRKDEPEDAHSIH